MRLRVLLPEDALVEARRVQPVARLQPQLLLQEREVVLVAGAEDDGVDLLLRAVLEMRRPAVELHQQRTLVHALRPVEAHRLGAPAHGDVLGAVFVALERDVLGRIAGADDREVLAGEFLRVAEIVSVQHAAGEFLHALEFRHVRDGEMAGGDDDEVEILGLA